MVQSISLLCLEAHKHKGTTFQGTQYVLKTKLWLQHNSILSILLTKTLMNIVNMPIFDMGNVPFLC